MNALKDLSAVAENLRSMARRKEIDVVEATNRIKFGDSNISAAIEFALEEFERTGNLRLLVLLGEMHVNLGQRVTAEAYFRSVLQRGGDLHVTNMIYCGLSQVTALVDDQKKLLYIAIPKCGSSTIKNYFTKAIHGKTYGEWVHFNHPELYRTITREDLETRYADYFRFTVVRDPVSRLVSYFTTNVTGRALRREAHGCPEFMGHTTLPGPRQVAQNFHTYRQLFIDFRHHTDPIDGYLNAVRTALDAVYTMSDLPAVRDRLSKAYGVELSDERAMVSADDAALKAACIEAFEPLRGWYQRDYETYF